MTKVKAEVTNYFCLQFCAKIHALVFFSADIICSEKRTVSRECNSRYINCDLRGTNKFQDKYHIRLKPNVFIVLKKNFAKGRSLILGDIFSKLCLYRHSKYCCRDVLFYLIKGVLFYICVEGNLKIIVHFYKQLLL